MACALWVKERKKQKKLNVNLSCPISDWFEIPEYDNLIGARYKPLCGNLIGAGYIPKAIS